MIQELLAEALEGKTILKITFKDKDENKLDIESLSFTSGELLTLSDQPVLSHPEYEAEPGK